MRNFIFIPLRTYGGCGESSAWMKIADFIFRVTLKRTIKEILGIFCLNFSMFILNYAKDLGMGFCKKLSAKKKLPQRFKREFNKALLGSSFSSGFEQKKNKKFQRCFRMEKFHICKRESLN
jgi:hypothetical protein